MLDHRAELDLGITCVVVVAIGPERWYAFGRALAIDCYVGIRTKLARSARAALAVAVDAHPSRGIEQI
jgi:hypothetical protein